jgi:hypothetical protein
MSKLLISVIITTMNHTNNEIVNYMYFLLPGYYDSSTTGSHSPCVDCVCLRLPSVIQFVSVFLRTRNVINAIWALMKPQSFSLVSSLNGFL